MKTIKIKLGNIKANPFKKFISGGKLNEETLAKLMEGYKQTTFHENIKARENKDKEIELIYGHHRLEAAKRVYGVEHEMKLDVYFYEEFSDENMLLDMIRENLTHRGDDYRDLSDSVILAKKWLESKAIGVKELDTYLKDSVGRKKTQDISQGIGARQVADFLAKQGKGISHATVAKVIGIAENLSPEIRNMVSEKLGRGTTENGKIGTELAYKLSSVTNDTKEQNTLLEAVKVIKEDTSEEKINKLLTQYKNSDEEIKTKVQKGEITLSEVPIENLKKDIKKKIQEEKEKNKGKITVTHYHQYQRQAGNEIGVTNERIIRTCALLAGLNKSGILEKLDWKTMLKIIEAGSNGGKSYGKFMDKIIENIK